MKIRFALFGGAGLVSIALAQSPGTLTPTGNMTVPRAGHTATLLQNGKVLMAGGVSGALASPIAGAELYDPATGGFEPAGSLITARLMHTATLLADGSVLIAGGRRGTNGGQDIGSAELYDPTTGTFVPTGAMTSIQGWHRATLLADGRVLMSGCAIPCNSALAELYDPASRRFRSLGAPEAGGDTATLLADGRVLITGGCPTDFPGTKAQLFDPASGTFSFTGNVTSGCADITTATLLPSGKVLLAGNAENDGSPADAALYEPLSGTFSRLGHTTGPHEFSAATLLPDGTVLITGGQLPGGNGDTGAELYLPATGTFVRAGGMNNGRHFHTATLLPDGSVLVAGGYSIWSGATASAEVYRPRDLIAAPVLSSLSGDGHGQGAILHPGKAETASADHPATTGEALEVYLTGLMEGSVIPPQVSIGGRTAEVLWFGHNQVNVRVPGGVVPGAAVPVRLTYLGRASNEVTIAVR
jgi:hypothetical protein